MAELIDKKTLREEIESLTVHVTGLRAGKGVLSKFMDEYRKSVLRIIDEQPTTTESEIRAKAIDEFAEKFIYKVHCEGCSGCTNCYETGTQDNCDTYRYFAEAAEELKAEQLKEE